MWSPAQSLLIHHGVLMLGRSPNTSQFQLWHKTSQEKQCPPCSLRFRKHDKSFTANHTESESKVSSLPEDRHYTGAAARDYPTLHLNCKHELYSWLISEMYILYCKNKIVRYNLKSNMMAITFSPQNYSLNCFIYIYISDSACRHTRDLAAEMNRAHCHRACSELTWWVLQHCYKSWQ